MKNSIILIIALIPLGLSAQTLPDYLKIASENSPGIKANYSEFEAAMLKVPQVSLPDPEVRAEFFLRPMMLPMGNQLGSISLMQMFPWFGTLEAQRNAAARMAEVKFAALDVAKNDLYFKVKNAYYPLWEIGQLISVKNGFLKILETQKELAVFKFQHGQAPMTDALMVDLMMDELSTDIALLEQKRKPLEVMFNKLLNRASDAPVNMDEDLETSAFKGILREDDLLANNPKLAIFDRQMQAAKAEEMAVDKMRKPMFSAGVAYMPLVKRKGHEVHIEPNTGRDMVMPMVSVTIPIWQKKYDAAVQENQIMQSVYEDMKKDMENDLSATYEMAYYELEKASQMAALLDSQAIKTQQIIDLLISAYSNNGQDFEKILDMQKQFFRYRTEKIAAIMEYQLAVVKMDYLIGKN